MSASASLETTVREQFDVIVIGGGQAGLSVGHYLRERGVRFVILDASERIGDSWRKRWDSLKLFTSARFDGLPGLPFPAHIHTFPTKDQMGDYLEAYAAYFRLPVASGVKVKRVFKDRDGYVVEAAGRRFEAAQLVVAMSGYQDAKVPDFADALRAEITQLHSSAYKSPAQLKAGSVLIVGAGNSGAEIGLELAKHGHKVVMAGRDTGQVPFRGDSFWGRNLLVRLLLRFVFHRILTVRTRLGRMARPKILSQGGPLIRVKSAQLSASGVERVARVASVRDGLPVLEDGRTLAVSNVIWCTGYHPAHRFIEFLKTDDKGTPCHREGVAEGEPGLYFVGLPFLYAMSSSMIHGVGRDAERIARLVIARLSARSSAAPDRTLAGPAARRASSAREHELPAHAS
jgi:putative flavoprotein involved in K+ transport